MARHTARGRRQIKSSNFVYPNKNGKGGAYPVGDRQHAIQALRMAARPNTKGSYSTVRKVVCRKYPSLGACQPTKRKGRR